VKTLCKTHNWSNNTPKTSYIIGDSEAEKKTLTIYCYQTGLARLILKGGNMETIWKLQDAKSQFSRVVENALKSGPQYVTRRGKNAVVVLSVRDYKKRFCPEQYTYH